MRYYIIGAGILLVVINFMIVPQPKQGEITIDNVPISITTASFEQAWKQNAILAADKANQKERIYGDGIIHFIGNNSQIRETAVAVAGMLVPYKETITEPVVDV